MSCSTSRGEAGHVEEDQGALAALEPNLDVVAQASDGSAAVDAALAHRLDVAVGDLEMPALGRLGGHDRATGRRSSRRGWHHVYMGQPDLAEAFVSHDVAVAYLFGSRAEGTAGLASDHDVAVLFASPDPALDATVRLGADLAAVLGTAVDVVDLDRADIELRGRVAERGRRLFSGDEARRVRFEVDARLRWIEFRPVVRDTTRAYLRRVAAAGLR